MLLGQALTAAPAARTHRLPKRLQGALLQARCRRPARLPAVLIAEPLLHLAQQAMPWFTPEEQWALALSTFAGLSTTIGALAAVGRRSSRAGWVQRWLTLLRNPLPPARTHARTPCKVSQFRCADHTAAR